MKLSQASMDFIAKYVLCQMGIKSVTDDNISDIIDFIVDNYEIPLAQAKENGECVDESLLDLAA